MDAGHAIHFARVDFRNNRRAFGIKDEDRFLHIYVIGKTGTGKSTLIETMALQELERGNGLARRSCRAHRRTHPDVAPG
jgi:type IV secretory pathway VirB4 component